MFAIGWGLGVCFPRPQKTTVELLLHAVKLLRGYCSSPGSMGISRHDSRSTERVRKGLRHHSLLRETTAFVARLLSRPGVEGERFSLAWEIRLHGMSFASQRPLCLDFWLVPKAGIDPEETCSGCCDSCRELSPKIGGSVLYPKWEAWDVVEHVHGTAIIAEQLNCCAKCARRSLAGKALPCRSQVFADGTHTHVHVT